ncbi:MAG: DUF5715 family protein [Clostridium sp.]|nr:DUF5715 family protein [Clostridium sp.]
MKRLKTKYFLCGACGIVLVLAVVRCFNPSVAKTASSEAMMRDSVEQELVIDTLKTESIKPHVTTYTRALEKRTYDVPCFKKVSGEPVKHRIYSVPGFKDCFSDLQDVQLVSARKWGVSPVADRQEAEQRKKELVYVGSNPFYTIDKHMNRSIPYLVPQASELLQRISRNFLDSLAIKGIPLHTLIVTSVLRTEEDVRKLRRHNTNATEQSCHRYGTTFDISYSRYNTVSSPDGPQRRAVRNDSLKWVLSEVLRDLREQGFCYVKHEVKQGCYHITVR